MVLGRERNAYLGCKFLNREAAVSQVAGESRPCRTPSQRIVWDNFKK